MSPRRTVPLLVALSALTLASCVSTTTKIEPKLAEPMRTRLPYRVALVPVTAGAEGVEGADAAVWAGFTEDLRDALRGDVFNEVVLLEAPTGVEASDDYWRRAARAANADLLVDVDTAEIDPAPRSKAVWSSYAFFLTGPLEIVFPDRRYQVGDTQVSLSVYDVNLLDAPGSPGPSGDDLDSAPQDASWRFPLEARLRELRVKPDGFKLRYGDRVEGGLGLGSILKSFVVPTAHLSENTSAAKQKVTESLCASLARNVASRIAENDEQFLRRPNSRMALFHVVGDPKVVLSARGEIEAVEVTVEAGSNVEITDGVVRVGDDAVDFLVGTDDTRPASTKAYGRLQAVDGAPGTHQLVVPLTGGGAGLVEASAPRAGAAKSAPQWVQLVLVGNLKDGSEVRTRSWTLPVVGRR